ncbi:transposase [Candidatus Uabimicrobium sp. HlEnr_7]|uniref:transposase n=1 Tax=Candidatus Uabimicrobium helgolandensis TaxID=3095367 RepID=UPI003556007B
MDRKQYKSDLNGLQWETLSKYFDKVEGAGRKPKYELREIINAVMYMTKTGCQWRMLPNDFPPYYREA